MKEARLRVDQVKMDREAINRATCTETEGLLICLINQIAYKKKTVAILRSNASHTHQARPKSCPNHALYVISIMHNLTPMMLHIFGASLSEPSYHVYIPIVSLSRSYNVLILRLFNVLFLTNIMATSNDKCDSFATRAKREKAPKRASETAEQRLS